MKRMLMFRALDGKDVEFTIPKGVNAYLARRAIERVHRGEDEALVMFGLTRPETEFVAEVVARLEDHRPKAEAVS